MAFWALVGFGGLMLAALALLIPETARNVVGMVTSRTVNGISRSGVYFNSAGMIARLGKASGLAMTITLVTTMGDRTTTNASNPEDSPAKTNPTRSLKFTSPLASIRVFLYLDTSLALWLSASYYVLWYYIQTSIPSTFKSSPYSFNGLQVGLAYLPGSVGVILSMYVTGKVMDHNYKHTAAKIGFMVDRVSGDDVANCPIEEARSRGCAYLLVLSFGVMLSYDWSIERHAPSPSLSSCNSSWAS
jgi:hypothetical protein